MKKLSSFTFIALVGFLMFSFFLQNDADANANAKKSYNRYLAGKALFIDVREKEEVGRGMIKGALWFPLSKIEQDKEAEIARILKATQGKEIYLYCKSGNRSGKVKAYLEAAGTKSENLGGHTNLIKENLPTQPGPIQ